MATWTNSLTLLTCVLILGGCASTKKSVIPQDGPDMRTIYETHMQNSGAAQRMDRARTHAGRPIQRGERDLRAYTREAANEINQVFPLLPNPQMVLYVYPHLSGEAAPVPGYSTAFPFYAVDQYALPGEIDVNP